MPRFRLPKAFQYDAWPDASHYIDGGLVGGMKRSATTPGADNWNPVFNRSRRDRLDSFSIILAEGIARLPQFIRMRGSPSEQVSDDNAARAFAPSKRHAAANGGIVFFGVRVRRIQHDERQQIILSFTPPPREFVAI